MLYVINISLEIIEDGIPFESSRVPIAIVSKLERWVVKKMVKKV